MSQHRDISRSTEPETVICYVTMTGTGNGTLPTKNVGRGVTLTFAGTGLVTLTWGDYLGTFINFGVDFQGIPPSSAAGVKGFGLAFGAFDTAGKVITASITNAAGTLVDLQAGQVCMLSMVFRAAGSATNPV
jgi:hypothetical protein